MASRDDSRPPDLQKLEEKLRKDPASKLFFPLAEEYIKAGRLQEAITLLRTGIKAHPDFLGARVALGKALLSKGEVPAAKQEFEQVVTANPDNLMAHKKLSAIYLKEGDKRKALASCEVILAVNPVDPEALRIREELERIPDAPAEAVATVQAETGVSAEDAEPTVVASPAAAESPADPAARVAGGLDAALEPTVVARVEDEVEPTVVARAQDEVEPTVVAPAIPDMGEIEPPEVVSLPAGELFESLPQELEAPDAGAVVGSDEAAADDGLATLSLADLYVSQGHYQRGIAIYHRLLERTPGDPEIAAKLENAVTLERLLAPEAVDAEAVKTEVVHHVLSAGDPADQESDGPALEASLAGAATGGSRHQAAIQRLEAWLARIAERRRQ